MKKPAPRCECKEIRAAARQALRNLKRRKILLSFSDPEVACSACKKDPKRFR